MDGTVSMVTDKPLVQEPSHHEHIKTSDHPR